MGSDVYAFGVFLWSLYSGQRPYVWLGGGWVPNFNFPHFKIFFNSDTQSDTLSLYTQYRRLAKKCLAAEPHKRPTFTEIKSMLSLILGWHEPSASCSAAPVGALRLDLATLARSRLQRAQTHPGIPGHRAAATSADNLEVRPEASACDLETGNLSDCDL